MRTKAIWMMIGMMGLWMVCVGASLIADFDRVMQSNRVTAEMEWTFISNGDYADIIAIRGGNNFISQDYNEIEYAVMDEKGRALSDTYDFLEPLGNGYVRFENTPTGVVIMEDGKNKRTNIGVLNDEGQELPKEEALRILQDETDGAVQDETDGAASHNENAETSGYHVAKGSRKYVGVKDSAGTWVIPPVFDKIQLTADQKFAVIHNSGNIGVAVLGE